MKIDFISSSLTGGGAERVLVLLANHFSEKGHQVNIITFNKGEAYLIHTSVSRIRLHSGKFKNHKLRSINSLIAHYKDENNRPDIVISFITNTNFISILAAKYYGIKIICSEHINYLQKGNYLTKFTRNVMYRFVNHVTVLTSFDLPFYKKKNINVSVMPNPCTYAPIALNNSNRQKVIIAVGNLDRFHHKGFDNLINLITPVLKDNKDWILKIIGEGNNGNDFLKKLAIKNNIENQIIFTGFRNDINLIMQESSIFIMSSRYEGLPMVLIEAMSQGMACISYDCRTGPADIIDHKKNGLLIENQNMEAMQNGLLELMNDVSLRNNLRIQAIKSLDRFTIENIGHQWEQLFRELQLPK
ncbi:MAG: glycosyltransferase family 4 protein [Arenibacter sp.]